MPCIPLLNVKQSSHVQTSKMLSITNNKNGSELRNKGQWDRISKLHKSHPFNLVSLQPSHSSEIHNHCKYADSLHKMHHLKSLYECVKLCALQHSESGWRLIPKVQNAAVISFEFCKSYTHVSIIHVYTRSTLNLHWRTYKNAPFAPYFSWLLKHKLLLLLSFYLSLSVGYFAKVISPLHRHSHYLGPLCGFTRTPSGECSFFSLL